MVKSTETVENKPFSKREKAVCQSIWGGEPIDTSWARSTKIFQNRLAEFDTWIIRWKKLDFDWYSKLTDNDFAWNGRTYKELYAEQFKGITENVYGEIKGSHLYEPVETLYLNNIPLESIDGLWVSKYLTESGQTIQFQHKDKELVAYLMIENLYLNKIKLK